MDGKQRCRWVNSPLNCSHMPSFKIPVDWNGMDMSYSALKNTVNTTGKLV